MSLTLPRPLILFGVIALVALVAGLAGVDAKVAAAVGSPAALDQFVTLLELVTLKTLSEFILPLALIAGGGAAWLVGRKPFGRATLYVGLVQLIAYLAADLSKPQFGRLRPFEAAAAGGTDVWFVGANSFPSGHVAYFAGLIVPIVMLWPRAWPLLLIPLLVAAQRVLSTDHYLSDAAASAVMAVLLAWAFRPVATGLRRRLPASTSSG